MTEIVDNTRLDSLHPRWRHRERHQLAIDAPHDAVRRAVRDLTWREVPLFRALFYLRGLGRFRFPRDTPILDTMFSMGFYVLDHTENEIVIGKFWPIVPGTPALAENPYGTEFSDFDRPGQVKIAFNFRYTSTLLTTETRVSPVGHEARRTFSRYWMVIRPFSGLIRRVWLHAIRRRAMSRVR